MPTPRTIAIVTGTRAEFGLLLPVMLAVREHRRLSLRTIVTGTHLTRGTWRDIVAAGVGIDERIAMQRAGATGRAADVEALARGIRGLGRTFAKVEPDFVVVLGDRIEAFAAASAASIGGIRVAHLHGGDRAEGVADEAMRHAISKLAHLHFPATKQSRQRLLHMGEHEGTVFNVGSPSMDVFRLYRQELALHRSKSPEQGGVVVVQHPIGDSDAVEASRMKQTLRAVERLHREGALTGSSCILWPNSDPGCRGIIDVIEAFVPRQAAGKAATSWTVHQHLPRLDFLRLLSQSRAIVGNSSAGLIEAAAAKCPCVNIGPRQGGREKPRSVIDCDYGETNVARAIHRALALRLDRLTHPYGDGRTGPRIASILASIYFDDVPLRKQNRY